MVVKICLSIFMCGAPALAAGHPHALLATSQTQATTATREASANPPVSEKQKAIEADTEKLVQMTAELKVSVDKSTKNQLSLDVIRKAEAVEKLARSLKERIRDTH